MKYKETIMPENIYDGNGEVDVFIENPHVPSVEQITTDIVTTGIHNLRSDDLDEYITVCFNKAIDIRRSLLLLSFRNRGVNL